MAELVDALDLGSSVERHMGSSPFIRTIFQNFLKYIKNYILNTTNIKFFEYKILPKIIKIIEK